jgi:hypothetical protein
MSLPDLLSLAFENTMTTHASVIVLAWCVMVGAWLTSRAVARQATSAGPTIARLDRCLTACALAWLLSATVYVVGGMVLVGRDAGPVFSAMFGIICVLPIAMFSIGQLVISLSGDGGAIDRSSFLASCTILSLGVMTVASGQWNVVVGWNL